MKVVVFEFVLKLKVGIFLMRYSIMEYCIFLIFDNMLLVIMFLID